MYVFRTWEGWTMKTMIKMNEELGTRNDDEIEDR